MSGGLGGAGDLLNQVTAMAKPLLESGMGLVSGGGGGDLLGKAVGMAKPLLDQASGLLGGGGGNGLGNLAGLAGGLDLANATALLGQAGEMVKPFLDQAMGMVSGLTGGAGGGNLMDTAMGALGKLKG
jgi:hypothetical protein